MSGSSPTTGAASAPERDAAAAADERPADRKKAPGRLTVVFEVLRGRAAGWAVFGVVAGILLIVMMGTVAQWLGAVLVAIGLASAWALIRTFVFPVAAIVVDDEAVQLPRGKCTRVVDRRPLGEVSAAYFLRRSVPWTRAAPVLVIEAAGRAYTYPRDWFVNEAEQRQIIQAILERVRPDALAGVSAPAPDRGKAPRPAAPRARV